MMWVAIMALVLGAMLGMAAYLVRGIRRFQWVRTIAGDNRKKSILTACGGLLVLMLILYVWMGMINMMVVLIHLGLIWMVCDGIAVLWRKLRSGSRKKAYHRSVYISGICAVIVTTCYLACGWYLAHHVWKTTYEIDTDKAVGTLRIVQFADSHIGATFHGEGFARHMEEIQACEPDIVLLTGDFVDDDSTKEDMIAACKALGNLKTTYGVYYSFGNHDKGYYGSKYRGYSGDELIAELEKNHVIVLQDEVKLIDDRFYIIGRQDRSEEQRGNERASMEELTRDLDPDKFSVVMDHQPHDYAAQAQSGVDLVLSGHTHGGQLIPINHVGEWIGENDRCYGYEQRDNTRFIVTSGISNWALKFKTGCRSEYVCIDIHGK